MTLTYLKNGETLTLDDEACTGCGVCIDVCPHAVFAIEGRKAMVMRRENCMECGACMLNCAFGALSVKAGVGCAGAIIVGKLRGTAPTCGCGGDGGEESTGGRSSCCGPDALLPRATFTRRKTAVGGSVKLPQR